MSSMTCRRYNNIKFSQYYFLDQHWCIQDVVRKTFLLHDECISYYPNLGLDPHSSRLFVHWIPPPEGTLKLNIDGSFLEDLGCLAVGGVVRNHDGDWIAGFSDYEAGGDALLAELRVIQIGLDFCSLKGYDNITCESDCLEAIDLIIDGRDHTLHTYATDILHIRVLEMFYMEMVIQYWCMFLGNKICVQILWLRKDHMQGVLLTGTALRLAWNLSF
jgi:hypothetical protein